MHHGSGQQFSFLHHIQLGGHLSASHHPIAIGELLRCPIASNLCCMAETGNPQTLRLTRRPPRWRSRVRVVITKNRAGQTEIGDASSINGCCSDGLQV